MLKIVYLCIYGGMAGKVLHLIGGVKKDEKNYIMNRKVGWRHRPC
jgi:hypothetical protein